MAGKPLEVEVKQAEGGDLLVVEYSREHPAGRDIPQAPRPFGLRGGCRHG